MYLARITIQNYKGIKDLEVEFDPNVNIIIGENGCCKSALIDAIRLLYNLGEQRRDIFVSDDDFHVDLETGEVADSITIKYEFRDLTNKQKGALYEYMVVSDKASDDYAQISLVYEQRESRGPGFSYYTGKNEGQKADPNTFELFQHYYLDALRDSTRDLLRSRRNILGELIHRGIAKQDRGEAIENIVSAANENLLEQEEVTDARDNINRNLGLIFGQYPDSQIGLHIETSRVDYIVNLIKPFLPFDRSSLAGDGFNLPQNSLGFNNLIYVATILGDINQRVVADELSHFVLLIEEPEAHLHPQLQLSLHNFLTSSNDSDNSQLFITTHSPTLTSKVPLNNLILLDELAYPIGRCFQNRKGEDIVQDANGGRPLSDKQYQTKKRQLQRYLDVTRSQLFFSKGILLVEGISEELLLPAFCHFLGYRLEDHRLELVNVKGTSFYPFLTLFNSGDELKRLPKRVAVVTDDDRSSEANKNKFSFNELFENDSEPLKRLHELIKTSKPANRIANLKSFSNNQPGLLISSGCQTLEYEIALNNVATRKGDIQKNVFVNYIMTINSGGFEKVKSYYQSQPGEVLTDEQKEIVALLLWKLISSKADFAQDFAFHLVDISNSLGNTDSEVFFTVPPYIVVALEHLTNANTL